MPLPVDIPNPRGSGLERRVGGVPLFVWIIGGAIALGVGFHFYKSKGSSAQPPPTPPPATQNPVAIDPSSAYVQGITDQNGNLLPQFTWPYNQLALPYNWQGSYTNTYNWISAQPGQPPYVPMSGGM